MSTENETKKQELISIIIPIYNVEDYICNCLDSILNQTYKNIEVLLVDDGSTDKCPEFCDEYAKKDSRVRVIHQKNGGVAAARNTGLDNMTGKYVSFVDSDDTIHPQMIEILYKEIRGKAEIAVADYKKTHVIIDSFVEIKDYNCTIQDKNYAIKQLFYDSCRWVVSWGKLYLAELFSEVRYTEGRTYEDVYTTHKLYHLASNVAEVNIKGYYYMQRDGSIMNQFKYEKYEDLYIAFIQRMTFLKENGYEDAYKRQIEIIEYNLHERYLKEKQKEKRRIIRKFYRQFYKIGFKSFNWKYKMIGMYNIVSGKT